MQHVVTYIARFLVGGLLVCAFALISDAVKPKRFSGLFSAAPSILTAGLAVTLFAQSAAHGVLTSEGAIAGAAGMIAYCLVSAPLIRRLKALAGATVALGVWCAVSGCAYLALTRVVGS